MRKYRLDRAHKMLKKYGLGSMIVYDFDNLRYLGYHTFHNYMRRRPGILWLLLIRDNGYPYCPIADPSSSDYRGMPWLQDKMKLRILPGTRIQNDLSFDAEWTAEQWTKQVEEIKSLLKQHRVLDEPCGIDAHFGLNTVRFIDKAGIKLVDGNPAMNEARMIKNEDEIECIRTAGTFVESAFWEVAKALRPGVTEWQMCGVAAKACFDQGAEEMEGPSFMSKAGPRNIGTGTDRVIRPGELFILDLNGISFQGYRTCFYRTFCVGDKPTEYQKELYQDTYKYQHSMEKNLKPGITSHDYVKAVFKENPQPTWPKPGRYARAHTHHLGLGSGDPGPCPHPMPNPYAGAIPTLEKPSFKLEKNMVFAHEVTVRDFDGKDYAYDEVKLENVGVITDSGCEVLWRFPYKDLITVGLPGLY